TAATGGAGLPRFEAGLLQPAAEDAIQRDPAAERRELGRDQRVLGRVQRALRHQRGQERVDAGLVARLGGLEAAGRGLDEIDLCGELLIDRAARRQRIGDLAKRALDRALVGRDQHALLRLGELDVGEVARTEQRQRQGRRERPYRGGAGEQRAE